MEKVSITLGDEEKSKLEFMEKEKLAESISHAARICIRKLEVPGFKAGG